MAPIGGGLYRRYGPWTRSSSASPKLTNCIVWDNVGGAIESDRSEVNPEVTFSCVEGESVFPGAGNINSDPLFDKGAVLDFERFVNVEGIRVEIPDFIVEPGNYHLKPGSPCIDSGTSDGAPTTDIEGNGRPCGAGVDMGAYESGDCPPPAERFTRGDANADGASNVADAVFVLSYLFVRGSEPPSCKKAADADDTGTVNLTDAVYLLNFLFSGGEEPAAPFAECGHDPTADELSCDSFPAC